jgi:hypothetical protein
MSSEITAHDIAVRLANFPHDRYLYVGGVMRSVAWAAGTVVLLQILRRRYWPRLLPWLVAFLSTMITLMTWGRGILFTNSRANEWDSVTTTLMGIAEFCLFAVLMPDESSDSSMGSILNYTRRAWDDFLILVKGLVDSARELYPRPGTFTRFLRYARVMGRDLRLIWKNRWANWMAWHSWFLILWIHPFLAIWLVWNRMALTDLANDYEPCLYKVSLGGHQTVSLPAQYMDWMGQDRIGATIASAVFLVCGICSLIAIHGFKSAPKLYSQLLRRKSLWAIFYLIGFLIPIYLPCYVVHTADKQRREAEDEIFKLEYAQTPLIPCRQTQQSFATPTPSPQSRARRTRR